MRAGLGLPPGIDDRALLVADLLVVPHPGFRVDRLTHAAEQAERGEIVILEPFVAPLDEGADGGRCGVENIDAVLLDDLPHAIRLGTIRHALIEEAGAAVGKNAVGDVAVAGDPADVGRTEVDILRLDIEVVLRRHVRAEQVARRGVQDALRLARAAAGVEDEKRVLAVENLGGAIGLDRAHFFMEPVIATERHGHFLLGALHHEDRLDFRAAFHRDIDILLHARGRAATETAVRRDDEFGTAIVRALLESLRAEAAENHAVGRTNTGAGEHGDNRLGDHRQIDHDAVALLDPVLLQHIGQKTHFTMQLGVGEGLDVARFAFENEGGLVAHRPDKMTIQAVDAGIDFATDEPLREGLLPGENLLPFLEPGQLLLGGLAPELIGIGERGLVHLLVLLEIAHERGLGKLRVGLEDALLLRQRFDVVGSNGR